MEGKLVLLIYDGQWLNSPYVGRLEVEAEANLDEVVQDWIKKANKRAKKKRYSSYQITGVGVYAVLVW